MTRINTNVSSLNAQKALAWSNDALQQALTRLSTGLRINVGKDDPAGLIASEVLRSDIISAERAITNSQRANQMIATADSALGQVSSLLNDIRGLVTEAANEGALSAEQIAANQLQVDSSLEAINRIAQMTQFQGRNLLDGSLDFVTDATGGQNFDDITDLEVNQATLGSNGIDVEIDISSAAETAKINNSSTVYSKANATLNFGEGFQLLSKSGAGNAEIGIILTDDTKEGTGIQVQVLTAGVEDAKWNAKVLEVTTSTAAASKATDIVDQINEVSGVYAYLISSADKTFSKSETQAAANMEESTLKIEVKDTLGPDYNKVSVEFEAGGALDATYDSTTKKITVTMIDKTHTLLTAIETEIEEIKDAGGEQIFEATPTAGGTKDRKGIYVDEGAGKTYDWSPSGNDTLATGGGALKASLVFELAGNTGVDVFSFEQYTTVAQMVAAINLVSDATGATASIDTTSGQEGYLKLASSGYGSDAVVSVTVVSEGTGGKFEEGLSATRETGSDIAATVNGYSASGSGNTLSINTATLDLSATIAVGQTDTIQFSITGGGAKFQLGPEVVATQQARIGIRSVNTARLGGVNGKLYELGSGQTAALASNSTTAGKIVDEVVSKVASLRGRMGAFQKTTLESNIATLSDTVENLTAAESSIRDADFASETAALTRAQILVQSGTSVLAIANTNPQNVLALLR